MKMFTLIHGGEVHIAPKQKIIPADAFGTLLGCQDLLEKVQEDAVLFKKESIEEIEKQKQIAIESGYTEGLNSWANQVFELEQEAQKIKKQIESVIVKISIKAAQKIVGKELELKPETIVDIISNTLKAVSQHKKITIYCSKTDFDILEKNKPKLKALFEQLEVLMIVPDNAMAENAYKIETERGIINHSDVEKVWTALENAFESQLSNQGS